MNIYTKSQYSFCTIIAFSKSRAVTQSVHELILMKLIGYQLSMILIIYAKKLKNASNLTYGYWDMVSDRQTEFTFPKTMSTLNRYASIY